MPVLNVLLIEDDDAENDRYIRCIQSRNDVKLSGKAKSVREGIELAKRELPDAVILDLELDDSHGMDFLGCLKNKEFPNRPAVVVITSTRGPYTIREVKRRGSERVFYKDSSSYLENGPNEVLDYLLEIRPPADVPPDGPSTAAPEQAPLTDEQIRERIESALIAAGGPRGTKSLSYMVDTMFILSRLRKRSPNLRGEAYRTIAEQNGVEIKAVRSGLLFCGKAIWDKLLLGPDCEKVTGELRVAETKDMPELKTFLLYLAKNFRHLWEGRSE